MPTTVDKIAQLHDVFELTLGPDEWAVLANLSEAISNGCMKKGVDYAIDDEQRGCAGRTGKRPEKNYAVGAQ